MMASTMNELACTPPENTRQQRHAVPQGGQTHVRDHVLNPVQKEQDTHEEEQVVVPGEHVLRAEIHERPDGRPDIHEEKRRLVLCYTVGGSHVYGPQKEEGARQAHRHAPTPNGRRPEDPNDHGGSRHLSSLKNARTSSTTSSGSSSAAK